jgi:hypothetical protein
VTCGRYAVLDPAGQTIMKREHTTHHSYYDPVCGYIHKFRLDDSPESAESGDGRVAESAADLPLIIAGSIAVGLLLIIGVLTL